MSTFIQRTNNTKAVFPPPDVAPTDLYYLMKLCEEVLDFCRKHEITAWLDWGTLLGYYRHQNIIPWDNDIDLCVLETDYLRFKDLLTNSEISHGFTFSFDRYDDPNGAFWIHVKEDPKDILGLDVVSYRIDSEFPHTVRHLMLPETVLAYPNYPHPSVPEAVVGYDFDYDELYPLQDVLFLGQMVKVPHKGRRRMLYNFGVDYLKDPTFLKEYNLWMEIFSEKKEFLKSSPFRLIEAVAGMTIDDAFKSKIPIVIKNPGEIKFNWNDFKATMMKEEKETWGYPEGVVVLSNKEKVLASRLLDEWSNNKLKHNLLDTQCHFPEDLFPPSLIDKAPCYVLTRSNNWTAFHTEEDYFGEPASFGGWIYLKQGRKIWYFISPEDHSYLSDNGYPFERLSLLSFTDLVHILDNYLWGKLYIAVLKSDEFIYFPAKWAHAVITDEKSFGLGGYFEAPSEDSNN